MKRELLTGPVSLSLFFIVALLLLFKPTIAQNTYEFHRAEDSLIRLSGMVEDDLKPKVFIDLSDFYIDSNLNKSDSFARLAYGWASRNNNPSDINLGLFQLGKVYFEKDSVFQARAYFDQVISNTDNERILGETLLSRRALAFYYLAQIFEKEYDSSLKVIEWAKQSLRIAENNNDSAFSGILHRFLGLQYCKLDLREDGVNELKLSQMYFENIKDERNLAFTYRLLAMYAKPAKALEYLHKAIEFYVRVGDSMNLALNLINMAYESQSVLGIEKTEAYYNKAYQIFKDHDFPYGQAYAMFILSGFYEKVNRLEDCYRITLKAIQYSIENGQTHYLAHSLKNMATFHNIHGNRDSAYYYFSILDTVSQKLNSKIPRIRYFLGLSNTLIQDDSLKAAEEMLREAMKLYPQRKNFSYKSRVQLYRSMIFNRKGDYKNQLRSYEQYAKEIDSTYNEARRKNYARNQLKYELKSLENKIKILRMEEEVKNARIKRNQQFVQVFGLGILLVGLLAVNFIVQFRKTREAHRKLMEKNLALLERNNKVIEKKLQSDLEPQILEKIRTKLDQFVIKEKAFLNPEISLDFLARKIKTNSAYLSKAVNFTYGSNFTNFINELRIREVQRLMRLSNYQYYSIEGFAKEVGFKSKSVFNHAFKKYTGLTPSYYIKFLQKNPDTRQ